MAKRLYVGNLAWGTTEEGLRNLFAQYGEVISVSIITDRETGRSRGFGFVEMENADEAIQALNEKPFEGRNLRVNEAQERKQKSFAGGGGGGGGRNRW